MHPAYRAIVTVATKLNIVEKAWHDEEEKQYQSEKYVCPRRSIRDAAIAAIGIRTNNLLFWCLEHTAHSNAHEKDNNVGRLNC